MEKTDCQIGTEFISASGQWRVTDVGTRVVVAIQLDERDASWFEGPPYAVDEVVFDEYDLDDCYVVEPGEPNEVEYHSSINNSFEVSDEETHIAAAHLVDQIFIRMGIPDELLEQARRTAELEGIKLVEFIRRSIATTIEHAEMKSDKQDSGDMAPS